MLLNCDPGLAHPGASSCALLDRYLAVTIDLHRQVKHAQWNVVGRGAAALRGTLDKLATALDYCCDLIAAHADLLGVALNGTVQVAAARSFLGRYPLERADARAHARAITAVVETVVDSLRRASAHAAESRDPETAALLIEIIRFIERDMWCVRGALLAVADKAPRPRDAPRVVAGPDGEDRPAPSWSERRMQFPATAAGHGGGAAPGVLS